jgi:excisionase family DNA binding protein
MKSASAPSSRSRLVALRRAADELGVPRRTLADVVHRGELPHLRIGTSIWLERADVDRWVESRKETAA